MFQPVSSNDKTLPYSYPFHLFNISVLVKIRIVNMSSLSFFLALNQGWWLAVAAGFKQEPKKMPSCGLLAVLLLQSGTVNSVGSNNQTSKSTVNHKLEINPTTSIPLEICF